MNRDETKLYNEDGAVAEAGGCGVVASLDVEVRESAWGMPS